MSFLGQEEQIRELQDRFKFVYVIVFMGMALLLGRLVYLQVLQGDKLRRYSEDNRIKRVKIPSPRGMIFDRNRTLLIDNQPAFDLEIVPQYLKESGKSTETIALLSKITKIPQIEITDVLKKASTQASFLPVKVKSDLNREQVAEIESWRIQMPGVQISEEIRRTNVYRDIASHLLGYIGEVNQTELQKLDKNIYKLGDSIGKFGLEKELETVLRGVDGETLLEVDALGRTKISKQKGQILEKPLEKAAIPGKNLILTIDQDLQMTAVKAFGDKIGSLVAINPKNGEILAMISRPSFDPTEFSRGIPTAIWNNLLNNENRPLRDKTLQDHYPPGSVFKVVTAIAGLEEGVIDEHTTFNCTGSFQFGNRLYHCHKKGGHGNVSIVGAIAQSCDTFFYKTALKLKSVDDIAKWAIHLGLGKRTGINLAREVPGLIPTEEWKRKTYNQPWNQGESLSVAIGQSFVLTTGLQLANLFASIANGGTLFKPFIVKQIENNDGDIIKTNSPIIVDQHRLSEKSYVLVKQGLWGVTNSPSGTAFGQRLPGMDFVGKTGSVQVIRISADKIYQKCENMKFKDRHHAMFAGFAPANDPMIAVSVIAEHACHGSSGAAPIAKEVIKAYLQKVRPDMFSDKVLTAKLKGVLPTSPSVKLFNENEDIISNDSIGDEALPLPPPESTTEE